MGERELIVSESFRGREDYKITSRPKFYTEQFERVCPYYIAFGMSYSEFWDGDVEIAKMYRIAHEAKMDEANHLAWLQGMYVYNAVGALAPILRSFSKGKAQPYPKEPYGASERSIGLTEEQKEDARHKKEDQQFEAYMTAWMSQVNKHMAQKAKVEEAIKEGGGADA